MPTGFDLYHPLADGSSVVFCYKKKDYEIHRSDDGWQLYRYNTLKDYNNNVYDVISDHFDDPLVLVGTVRIEGVTISDIFRYHEDDMIPLDREYDYQALLRDLDAGAEIEFTFRGVPYAILSWREGWEFSAGGLATVTMGDVRTLVKSIKIQGMSLEEIFDHHYRKDNRGELIIDGLSHSLANR